MLTFFVVGIKMHFTFEIISSGFQILPRSSSSSSLALGLLLLGVCAPLRLRVPWRDTHSLFMFPERIFMRPGCFFLVPDQRHSCNHGDLQEEFCIVKVGLIQSGLDTSVGVCESLLPGSASGLALWDLRLSLPAFLWHSWTFM